MPELHAPPALKLESVSAHYGPIHALKDVSFEIAEGEIVALIGANGAGKTTTLRLISGLVRPSSGRVSHRGRVVTGLPPHQIARAGIAHAPEGRGIFLNLSVEENLDLGSWSRSGTHEYASALAEAFELFPRLKERRTQNAGTLSGGELQMLSIARALMGNPDILLLDEPSLGLAPQMIERIFEVIQRVNRAGKTILLVEQNALQALEIAHRGLVLETGRISLSGLSSELMKDDRVRQAYLGD